MKNKEDINVFESILQETAKKKPLEFKSKLDKKEDPKINLFLDSIENEINKEEKEKEISQPLFKEGNSIKKGKTKLVTLSTTQEVILMEEELKEIYERNGSIIPFNRSAIYKLGLKTILNENKKNEEIRKKYEKF